MLTKVLPTARPNDGSKHHLIWILGFNRNALTTLGTFTLHYIIVCWLTVWPSLKAKALIHLSPWKVQDMTNCTDGIAGHTFGQYLLKVIYHVQLRYIHKKCSCVRGRHSKPAYSLISTQLHLRQLLLDVGIVRSMFQNYQKKLLWFRCWKDLGGGCFRLH